MAKKKAKAEEVPEIAPAPLPEMKDLFVGGEEDDLMDMEYIQDETTTTKVETMPPETKEEAEAIAEAEPKEEVEEDVEPEAKEEEEEAKEEEAVPPVEAKEEEKEAEDPKIPKDRFDEINERMKKAEEKNKLLEQQIEAVAAPKEPEPEPYDYATKEAAAMDALLEGDKDKYAEIRADIRTAERADTLREAKKLAAQGDQQLQETLTFEEVGAKIEAEYPAFSETSETYLPAAREELLDLYLGYAQSGSYTRVQALQRAAAKAAQIHGLNVPEAVPDNVVNLKQPDPKTKAAIANKQPPVMEGKVDREEEPTTDVGSMSDEEFSALPESAKRRLRGDIL